MAHQAAEGPRPEQEKDVQPQRNGNGNAPPQEQIGQGGGKIGTGTERVRQHIPRRRQQQVPSVRDEVPPQRLVAYSELYGKEVRYCSDRKEAKDHGADKGNFLGSELKDGDRVIMIEDVTTSGKSMEETVPKVKGAANVEIVGLMVSLNRMEIGKGGEKCALDEVKELYGFDTAAIVDMEEVVECLYNKECNGKVVIDDTLKAAIDAYYEQYGAKH